MRLVDCAVVDIDAPETCDYAVIVSPELTLNARATDGRKDGSDSIRTTGFRNRWLALYMYCFGPRITAAS
jgi:hypothetical protein